MAIKRNMKNNVQKYRVWKNILQKDLANEVKCSATEIRLIEGNKVTPGGELRKRICEYFGVSHNQMFYEED